MPTKNRTSRNPLDGDSMGLYMETEGLDDLDDAGSVDSADSDDVYDFDSIPEPLPIVTGDYLVEIVNSTFGRSKKGNKLITIKARVIDGDYEGERVYGYLTFSDTDRDRYTRSDISVILGRQISGSVSLHDLAAEMEGVTLKVHVTASEYNGRMSGKIDRWLPAGSASSAGRSGPVF